MSYEIQILVGNEKEIQTWKDGYIKVCRRIIMDHLKSFRIMGLTGEAGTNLIYTERNYQCKRWPVEHDDWHKNEELAQAAAELAANNTDLVVPESVASDWGLIEKNPNRIRQLVIAGALIAAEIDRLLRLELKDHEPEPRPLRP